MTIEFASTPVQGGLCLSARLLELLAISEEQHDHICPRQVLGVRMGMLAADLLGLDLPQSDKRLRVFVETDGCFVDGIQAATGCSVGHRTLWVMDYGKIATTFVDSETERAIRIIPHHDSRERVKDFAPAVPSRWHQYLEGYKVMPDDALFSVQSVELTISLQRLISTPDARTMCDVCGEEIINQREVIIGNQTLCRACNGDNYYR